MKKFLNILSICANFQRRSTPSCVLHIDNISEVPEYKQQLLILKCVCRCIWWSYVLGGDCTLLSAWRNIRSMTELVSDHWKGCVNQMSYHSEWCDQASCAADILRCDGRDYGRTAVILNFIFCPTSKKEHNVSETGFTVSSDYRVWSTYRCQLCLIEWRKGSKVKTQLLMRWCLY
jgi:hypothetical protein